MRCGKDDIGTIKKNVHTYTHVHIYTYTHTHIYTHIYIHIHIYTYTHIHIHTYTHIYTCARLIGFSLLDYCPLQPQMFSNVP